MSWLNWLRENLSWPKRCPMCKRWSITIKRRHNTFRYVDDKNNYDTVCLPCMKEIWDYARERWAEYYSEIM